MNNARQGAVVCASIVIYHPESGQTEALIGMVRRQARHILVIDNGSSGEERQRMGELARQGVIEYLPQAGNVGVSIGHNLAFARARSLAGTHLLMLDQDSRPAADMVERLLHAEAELVAQGHRIAALGPAFADPRNARLAPFIRRENWKIRKLRCGELTGEAVEVDYLITSGALVRLDVLEDVGGLDEPFFIDYVDIEWGLRAKARGYQSFGVCSARMAHPIGDNPLRLPALGVWVPLHSPLRHYYHVRNALLLYRRSYAPIKWVLNDAYRLFLKFIVYSLFAPTRWQHFRMMLLGVGHGLTGQAGPFKS